MYSADYGDTIPPNNLSEAMRYLHFQSFNNQVKDMMVDREGIAFVDVLSVMATRKDASSKDEPKEFVEDDCYFFDPEAARYRDEDDNAPSIADMIDITRIHRRKQHRGAHHAVLWVCPWKTNGSRE
eukprot:TRINITY_DN14138_c0_g1_i1.p1 TRINITY_DN14138_c0_g1~~TRINITY_DN14138_c0_g1_i1.p1  ORF type:complete len:126 (+),score=15.64 TRINITY_DN14138_c0_g1_i1:480-857(+)